MCVCVCVCIILCVCLCVRSSTWCVFGPPHVVCMCVGGCGCNLSCACACVCRCPTLSVHRPLPSTGYCFMSPNTCMHTNTHARTRARTRTSAHWCDSNHVAEALPPAVVRCTCANVRACTRVCICSWISAACCSFVIYKHAYTPTPRHLRARVHTYTRAPADDSPLVHPAAKPSELTHRSDSGVVQSTVHGPRGRG